MYFLVFLLQIRYNVLERVVVFLKKENLFFLALLAIIVLIACGCGFLALQKVENNPIVTDAAKIKEEYEILNGQINEKNNLKYPTVTLSDDNPFVYRSESEIVNILKNKTGVIYFGFSSCPWCRSILPILEDAAKEVGLAQVFYLDIQNIRDVLELDENNKVVTSKEGSNGYYQIVELLDEYLSEYSLTNEKGEEISTGKKRLFAPTVVGVLNGEIVSFHEGSLDSQKSGYDALDDKEKEELKKIYVELIQKTLEGTCNEAC